MTHGSWTNGSRRGALALLCGGALVAGLLVTPGAARAQALAPIPLLAPPAAVVPSTVTFSGAGWGHGVGLSQYGALGMARDGYSASQIVQHYYTGTTVAPVRDDMDLRINLLHRAAAVTLRAEALSAGGGGLQVKLAGSSPRAVSKGSQLRFVRRGPLVKVVLRPAAGGRQVLGTAARVMVRWAGTRHPGGTGSVPTLLDLATTFSGLNSTGHRYRYGAVQISTSPGVTSGLEAVNLVQLHQEYLLGIAEVPSSWPAAALQAQVLAARSYALSKYAAGVKHSCRCQMDDGGGPYYDQTFVGYQPSPGWAKAVAATVAAPTTGLAVLYQGKPITAFYSSSTGGRTQASKDVWGGNLPYAQSVDDHWSLEPSVSPWAVWSPRTRSQAQLSAAFGLPDVATLDLTDRTVANALRTVTATDSTGRSATISGAAFASRLGLPSRWVWRARATVSADPVGASVAAAAALPAATAAVVASSTSPLDAAIAASFAAAKRLPLLLTPPGGLSTAVKKALQRRAPATVYAIGTAAELPTQLVTAIRAMKKVGTVQTITGTDPTTVSLAVAKALGAAAGTPVIVASASSPPDVTSAAAAAGALRRPLVVLPAGTGPVPANVSGWLRDAKVAASTLVAPATAVPDSVGRTLPGARRVAGADDADLSAQLALALFPATSRAVVGLAPLSAVSASAAVVAAGGRPVVWVGSSLPASTRTLLQTARTSSLAVIGAVPASLAWAARWA